MQSKSLLDDQAILIVEDSPEDYEATSRALRNSPLAAPTFHCQDGDEALDFLHRRGPFSDPQRAPRPTLILLDLNLPGTDGRELLRQIKSEPELQAIPVVVLTTSSDYRDVDACYSAGANSYIQKPVDLTGFFQSIAKMAEYWFRVALIPRRK